MLVSDEVKYNRVYARIDVDNFKYNISTLKSSLKDDMKVLLVVKADAYGHGAVELAQFGDDLADYLVVATIDEAIELRKNNITKPILIIGYTDSDDFDKLIEYDITQAVYDLEECEKLSEIAVAHNKKAKVHIKVDTGMSRIGFLTDDLSIESAKKLKELPGLDIEGIFTHYAKADEIDKQYCVVQRDRFKHFIDALEKDGFSFRIKHIDNSAGAMELDDNEFDMVRMGIIMYGLYPSDEVDKSIEYKPVMSLIAHVAHVKTLDEGVGIGYGLSYVTKRKTRVATVTIGYADGYPRALSNKGHVIIHGEYAPVIGRVCMDQIMIDVTDIDGVCVKDEVILIGKCGDKEITVEEIAKPAASFNYELVCNISRRVPRVYSVNGKDEKCVNYLI